MNRGTYRPTVKDVLRLALCHVRGHDLDGQFCARCGWFLP